MSSEWDYLGLDTFENEAVHDTASVSDDVEVISNPPSITAINTDEMLDDGIVSADEAPSPPSEEMVVPTVPPRILYSDIVKRPPQKSGDSDVDVVGDFESPQLEYDDEDYINSIIRSTKLASSDSGDSDSEVLLPTNSPTMSRKELSEKEIVLEVNLTLLSFSIFIGMSGLSGFILGGIYSAVLTHNISPTTGIMQYPGSLPEHFYKEDFNGEMCPNNECSQRYYRLETNMKHLKETMSHDIRSCYKKLKRTSTENMALHRTLSATAHHNSNQCSQSKVQIAKLQSESAALLAKLDDQKSAFNSLRRHANSESARSSITIASLRQMLENSRGDLIDARRAVSTLDKLNNECRKSNFVSEPVKSSAIASAKRSSDEASFWKNLYKHTITDLEEAEKKLEEMEKHFEEEADILKKAQDKVSEATLKYNQEKNAKLYYKTLVEKYSYLLGLSYQKYSTAIEENSRLGREFKELKYLSGELELSLETCSNHTREMEQRSVNLAKSKDYVERMLLGKLQSDHDRYTTLKDMYVNQEKLLAEMEAQRDALASSLVKKIRTNRNRFRDAKLDLESVMKEYGMSQKDTESKLNILRSKIGKNRNDKFNIKSELEESKAVIAEYQEQFELFESHTRQIEANLKQLREDIAVREVIQKEYIASKDREHKKELENLRQHYKNLESGGKVSKLTEALVQKERELEVTTRALNRRIRLYNKLQTESQKLRDEVDSVNTSLYYWKESHHHILDDNVNVKHKLSNCNEGKGTAITEYKKTTSLLMDLIEKVASKSKCPRREEPPLSLPIATPPFHTLFRASRVSHPIHALALFHQDFDVCTPAQSNQSSSDKVMKLLRTGSGENFAMLQRLYNTTSNEEGDLEMCMDTMGPLFPGASSGTLKNLLNITRSDRVAAKSKMAKALQKYWGGVEKSYRKLSSRDDDDEEDDWYFRRFNSPKLRAPRYPEGPKRHHDNQWYINRKHRYAKGEYSSVNTKFLNEKKKRRSYDCREFRCSEALPSHFAFDLCGC